jgi:hypothetical protein
MSGKQQWKEVLKRSKREREAQGRNGWMEMSEMILNCTGSYHWLQIICWRQNQVVMGGKKKGERENKQPAKQLCID